LSPDAVRAMQTKLLQNTFAGWAMTRTSLKTT